MLEALAELSSALLRKNLVLVLIPGLVVPWFVQYPSWDAILGSLMEPVSPIVFAGRMLWDIIVIGVLSSVAFEALVYVFAVLRLADDRINKNGFKVISGGAIYGTIGVLLLFGYQLYVNRGHGDVPPGIVAYVCAVLIWMQAGPETT